MQKRLTGHAGTQSSKGHHTYLQNPLAINLEDTTSFVTVSDAVRATGVHANLVLTMADKVPAADIAKKVLAPLGAGLHLTAAPGEGLDHASCSPTSHMAFSRGICRVLMSNWYMHMHLHNALTAASACCLLVY